jgi:predicted flap endonuclease-1-like 5' DNA nuclease
MMLRWRMLYLERRAAYLQEQVARAPAPAPVVQGDPDADRWKWRARYLEARVRHLEQQPSAAPVAALAEPASKEPVLAPAPIRQKPAVMAAPRNGAPDDFTLIEDVSVLQQTTLYSLGVFHFDQIAAWSSENVAWVDHYLRLRGRIGDEEWVEQAQALARGGVRASRRLLAEEDA